MVENMLIIEGDAYVADYMTKITKGYSSDKYAVMEFIYNLFKYGKSKDCNLGQDLYSVIEEYIEDIDCFRGYSDNYVRCYINKSSLDSKGLGTDNLINRFITARGICETEDGLECEI